MNNKKLNTMFLNYMFKTKKLYMEESENQFIITDSYAIYFIDKKYFYLNKEVFKECELKKRFIDGIEENYNLEFKDSGIIKDKKFIVFKSDDGIEKLINKDLVACINLDKCKFISGTEKQDLLLIYENENLIAAVLPVVVY